jgi:hypothetical protein
MATQCYIVTPHLIETLLTWVKSREIAIPEIQRPFVWDATKVRYLLDSLYGVDDQGLSPHFVKKHVRTRRIETIKPAFCTMRGCCSAIELLRNQKKYLDEVTDGPTSQAKVRRD